MGKITFGSTGLSYQPDKVELKVGGAPKCPRCNESVYFNEEKKALGKTWHSRCFTCAACKKRLDNNTCSGHDGEIYCLRCHRKEFGPKGYGFAGGMAGLSTESTYDNVRPVSPVHTHTVPQNLPDKDLAHNDPECCPRCGKRVYFAEELKARGRKWHKPCFKCAKCQKVMDPGRCNEHESEVYCSSCYVREFGPSGYGVAGMSSDYKTGTTNSDTRPGGDPLAAPDTERLRHMYSSDEESESDESVRYYQRALSAMSEGRVMSGHPTSPPPPPQVLLDQQHRHADGQSRTHDYSEVVPYRQIVDNYSDITTLPRTQPKVVEGIREPSEHRDKTAATTRVTEPDIKYNGYSSFNGSENNNKLRDAYKEPLTYKQATADYDESTPYTHPTRGNYGDASPPNRKSDAYKERFEMPNQDRAKPVSRMEPSAYGKTPNGHSEPAPSTRPVYTDVTPYGKTDSGSYDKEGSPYNHNILYSNPADQNLSHYKEESTRTQSQAINGYGSESLGPKQQPLGKTPPSPSGVPRQTSADPLADRWQASLERRQASVDQWAQRGYNDQRRPHNQPQPQQQQSRQSSCDRLSDRPTGQSANNTDAWVRHQRQINADQQLHRPDRRQQHPNHPRQASLDHTIGVPDHRLSDRVIHQRQASADQLRTNDQHSRHYQHPRHASYDHTRLEQPPVRAEHRPSKSSLEQMANQTYNHSLLYSEPSRYDQTSDSVESNGTSHLFSGIRIS